MTLISEFKKIVKLYPDLPAVRFEDEVFSYKEIDEFSNYIADFIDSHNIKDEVIGVFVKRSILLIATILGVLKTGKTYLPIDTSYPENRINDMLDIAGVNCVITIDDISQMHQIKNKKIITLSSEYQFQPFCKDYSFDSKSVACLLFTSGSTGKPNAVLLSHSSILNTVKWAIKYYGLNSNDVSLQVPSCAFVSSVQDIFSTLLSGGMLLMVRDGCLTDFEYINAISSKYKVTHFDMVPSMYAEYLNAMVKNEYLRFVLLAGEALPSYTVKEHRKQLPNVSVINEYGMTEVSSCFCFKKLKEEDDIVIGVPIDNMSYLIMDKDMFGVGELYICGEGLAKGYMDELLNETKFLNINGKRYFKTGDFVQENSLGELKYICRKDDQVKINGQRINLLEIDYCLNQNYNTKKSITVIIENAIVSFIETDHCNKQYYFEFLKNKLPKFFLPNYIKLMSCFDYLPNKKINIEKMKSDLKKELTSNKQTDNIFEKLLLEVSGNKLLSIESDVSLEYQGVDSLTMIRFIAELESQFNVSFTSEDVNLLQKNSIRQIADIVNSKRGEINL